MVTGFGNTKYEFGRHLAHLGFELGKPREEILREFQKHLGEERYRKCAALLAGKTSDDQNRVYDFMQDMREANLLRSACLDATLDTSYYLYQTSRPKLTAGTRVIELACWTGGLTSFIAERHPDCTVVGVDRAKRIIEVDRDYFDLPNLSFMEWDYRQPKPGDLEPADVLLCGLGTNNDSGLGIYHRCDPGAIRNSTGYRREREEGLTYFRNWRQAAKDGASLVTVLRVFTFPRFLAFMDAAQIAGWTPLLNEFTFIQVPSNNERAPSLLFTASPSEPLAEDVALSHWTRIISGKHEVAEFVGPSALALYRALGNKRVIVRREGRNNIGLVNVELGTCGSFGYLFAQDARPEYRLTVISVERARALERAPAAPSAVGPSIVSGLVDSLCSQRASS